MELTCKSRSTTRALSYLIHSVHELGCGCYLVSCVQFAAMYAVNNVLHCQEASTLTPLKSLVSATLYERLVGDRAFTDALPTLDTK